MNNSNEYRIKLESKDKLTLFVKEKGIVYWEDLLKYIKKLPYGRNANRIDLSLVMKEMKGTCSSKHAFLKEIADKNNIKDVHLILSIYKMKEKNTPKIENTQSKVEVEYIPEAHCYLNIKNKIVDLTMIESDFSLIKKDLLKEIEIKVKDIGKYKVDYHKKNLKKWIIKEKINFSFEEIWELRENCIRKLEK